MQSGDPVLLSFYSCGACDQCAEKHPSYCHSFAMENYVGRKGHVNSAPAAGEDGKDRKEEQEIYSRFFGQSSFSRYSIVDKASVVNAKDLVRNEEEMKLFAPLGCGFQTGMGAIDNTAQVGENSMLVVSGLGSVGLAALMVRIHKSIYHSFGG